MRPPSDSRDAAGPEDRTTVSEISLIDRAVNGDEEALTELLERFGPTVRQSLARSLPHRWQAVLSVDDVMQETYIDAFLDIGHFEPRGVGSFVAWLQTLARRNLLDALRMLEAEKRGRNRRSIKPESAEGSLLALAEQLGTTNATPSRHAAKREAGGKLQDAIQRLPETYRYVVEQYDLIGRPVDEIAAALSRSPGAVFMLRSRAHRQLGALMGTPSQFLSGDR